MQSIEELRARLKTREKKKKHPCLPFRTCVEILLKMDKQGFFKTPGLIFSLDGQDVLTVPVLDQEIVATLCEEFQGRCRVSELSRSLNVAEEHILSRVKCLKTLTLFLNDVIHDSWFASQVSVVADLVNRSGGALKLVNVAEKISVSVDLFEKRILPLIPKDEIVLSASNALVTKLFLEIIRVRVRGLLHGLDVPRDLDWIASQVGSRKEEIETLVAQHESGSLGKDKIFTPNSWIKKQIESAYSLWERLHWIPLSGLRLEIGNGKSEIDKWLASQKVENFLILSECIVKITRDEIWMIRESAAAKLWIDVSALVSAKLGCPVTNEDGVKIATFFKSRIPELRGENWILNSSFLVNRDILSKRNFSDIPIYEDLAILAEQETARKAALENRPLSERIEEQIIAHFFSIVEAISAVKKLGKTPFLISQFRKNLLFPFTDCLFRYVLVRFCGAKIRLDDPVDHQQVIKSLPTVGGQKSEFEKPLLELSERISNIEIETLDEWLKQLLSEVGIVIPKKRPAVKGFLAEYFSELESSFLAPKIVEFSLKFFLAKKSNHRIDFLTVAGISEDDLRKLGFSGELESALLELLTEPDLRRTFEIKDMILNSLSKIDR